MLFYVEYGLYYIRNKRRTGSFQTTRRGGQLGWRLFSFSDGVFYLTHVLVERLRVIFIDYNYQYLAKCQSLYLVLFLIIYIGGDETILCTICILPPGFLLIPMEHMFYGKKNEKIVLKHFFGFFFKLKKTVKPFKLRFLTVETEPYYLNS